MGRLKKLAIFVLALAVAATAMPLYAVSASGEGETADNPILIYTVDDLMQIENGNKYYRLENDIYINQVNDYDDWTSKAPQKESDGNTVSFDFSDWFNEVDEDDGLVTPDNMWTPIENFSGHLDGNEHTIYGLYIYSENGAAGFIKNNNGEIKKLGFEKFLIVSNGTTGTVATVNNGTIEQVYADGKIVSGGNNVGGIAGINNGTVQNCASYGSTKGCEYVGGLVGTNTATVKSSFVSGNVKGASSEGAVCGDSASLTGTATVVNCYYCVSGVSDDNATVYNSGASAGLSQTYWSVDGELPKLNWTVGKTDRRCGEDLFWEFDDEDGTFSLSGTGAMYGSAELLWKDEADLVKTLSIGDDMTEFDETVLKAIAAFTNLEEISVWNNETYQNTDDGKFLIKNTQTIGADGEPKTEKEITIGLSNELPEDITSIGEYAFCGRNIDKIEINIDIDNEGKDYSKPDGSGITEIKAHAFEDSALSEITIVGDPIIGESAIPASAAIKGFKNTRTEAYSTANGNTFEPLDNFSLHSYQEHETSKDRFRINEVIAFAGYCDYAMVTIKGEMVKGGKVKVLNQSAKITTVYKYLNSSEGPCAPIEGKYFSTINMTGLPQSGYDYIKFTITPTVYNIYGGEYSTESKVLMYSPEKGVYLPTDPTQDDEDEEDDGGYLKLMDSEGNGVTADWDDFYDGVLKFVPDGGDGLIAFWRDFTKSVTD